eukprot:TRINITY_DN75110_c0_g1_i1.p1 TRINITY_DN75110_c0_g1~~TRINITY_DN75110_c0_g1_i1.p1  ORF type:complete len:406 (+),score=62.88 TRINITY_DN75110_c0_g1_i1:23-1240(+)
MQRPPPMSSFVCQCRLILAALALVGLLTQQFGLLSMQSEATEVSWGIIGCGDVTEKKSGPGFQLAKGSHLHAVMRRHGDKARDYAKRHKVAHWYDNVDELLRDERVSAVYVATLPGSHLEIALKVAAAGKPCYMEKPMARSYSESVAMAKAFEAAQVPLFVAYYRRAYPRYVKVKAMIDSGDLGELSSVSYTLRRPAAKASGWRTDVSDSGGGLFLDVGSHILDLLDFLLGPLRDVAGVAARSLDAEAAAPEDTVSMTFKAAVSAVGNCSWNFRATESSEMLEVIGSRGRLRLPDPMNGQLILADYTDGRSSTSSQVAPPEPAVQEPLIQTVVDAILADDAKLSPSTAESALRTARIMDVVLDDFYGGRADRFWEHPERWAPNSNGAVGSVKAKPPTGAESERDL